MNEGRGQSSDDAVVPRAWSGAWWCLRCGRQTELLDSDAGVVGQRCARCHSLKIKQYEPEPLVEPNEGRKAQKLHRLEPAKRDLRLLTSQGYWFCNGCQTVTELDLGKQEERCVLCKSDKVEWNEPIFKESA